MRDVRMEGMPRQRAGSAHLGGSGGGGGVTWEGRDVFEDDEDETNDLEAAIARANAARRTGGGGPGCKHPDNHCKS